MLTSKQAYRKILKVYDKSKYKTYDEEVAWYVDRETEEYYTCKFNLHGQDVEIKCNKSNGVVEVL